MTEKCKPIMALLMIVMVSLVVSTRTSKQLYLTPYHLSNGPIVPYVPYWTQYGYPTPAVYPTFGQAFADNKFLENQTDDIDSGSLIVQTPEDLARQRQGFFQTLFQNLFFGGAANACPSCPSCPIFKPCQTCGELANPKITSFDKCETNGFSSAFDGTINVQALTAAQVCLFTIGVPLSNAQIDVTCTALTLGAAGKAEIFFLPNLAAPLVVTAGAANFKTSPTNSVFFKVTNGAAPGGPATCTWALPASNTITACTAAPAFTSAASGTIKIAPANPTTAGACDIDIGSKISTATIKVTCVSKDLGTGDVTVLFGDTATPVSVPTGTAGVTSITNMVKVRITNAKPGGAVDCAWAPA